MLEDVGRPLAYPQAVWCCFSQGALPIDERSSTLFAAVLACHHMLWLVNIKMHDAPPVFSPESPEKETTTSVP